MKNFRKYQEATALTSGDVMEHSDNLYRIISAKQIDETMYDCEGDLVPVILIERETVYGESRPALRIPSTDLVDLYHDPIEEPEDDFYPDGSIKPTYRDMGDRADEIYERRRDNS